MLDYAERKIKLAESIQQQKISRNYGVKYIYKPFSVRQKQVLTWWLPNSPVKDREGIIADGAIRAGKTIVFSFSFALWAMTTFNEQNFLICGKTIGALRRNLIIGLKQQLTAQGFNVIDRRTDSMLIIRKNNVCNYFYMFGGSDERSQDLVQGR